jgi:HEAT repeat protein
MKRKIVVAALVIGLAAMMLLLMGVSAGRGPEIPDRVVQGKLISVWVKEELFTDQYYKFTPALKEAGDDAVPFFIPALARRDSIINSAYVKLWTNLPGVIKRRLETPILARDVRLRAVVALREMGPPARAAVPALIARLSDPNGTVRLHSAIALGNIGPDARRALPALEPSLKSQSYTVRVYTAHAVWQITRQPEPALSILKDGLKDQQAAFRYSTAIFLGEMGEAATSAIPALELAARDPDMTVASCAIRSLGEIGPSTTPILTNLLADPNPALRIDAATALGKLGAQARIAVPLLVQALGDHATANPTLIGRANPNEEVSQSAAAALKAIDPETAAKVLP